MPSLLSVKIGARLAVGFSLVLALTAAVALVGLVGLRASSSYLDNIVHQNVAKMKLLNDMSEQIHIASRVLRTIVILDDQAQIQREAGKITDARRRYDEAWAQLQKMPASEEGRALRLKTAKAASAADQVNDKVIALAGENKDAEAIALLLQDAAPKVVAWQAALRENVELQTRNNELAYTEAHQGSVRAEIVLVLVAVLATVIGLAAAWAITRGITRPLRQAVDAAEAVAAGDLTQELQPSGRDEVADLLKAMARMVSQLRTTVASVRGNAQSVSLGSAEIAQGNQDLSSRTEQQASALEETAASMEQLGATVRQNAESAAQANELASAASQVALQGGAVVGEVVETMKGIHDSSRRIADIIGVIDGIAFQTNILALNAAVEAARAGEQGRGFAVVATEVRTLAKRSADAAKEIKSLIATSVERVEQGTELVDRAGKTMSQVVDSIRRVTEIVAGISSASAEQAAGVSQVAEAVTQMDQTTQQNAALVEQSAAAAESLRNQAEELVHAVSVFMVARTATV